jgi:hypothetical protein
MKRGEVFEDPRGLRKALKRRAVEDAQAVILKSQRLYRPDVHSARSATSPRHRGSSRAARAIYFEERYSQQKWRTEKSGAADEVICAGEDVVQGWRGICQATARAGNRPVSRRARLVRGWCLLVGGIASQPERPQPHGLFPHRT